MWAFSNRPHPLNPQESVRHTQTSPFLLQLAQVGLEKNDFGNLSRRTLLDGLK
jgi:hypothetical protein